LAILKIQDENFELGPVRFDADSATFDDVSGEILASADRHHPVDSE